MRITILLALALGAFTSTLRAQAVSGLKIERVAAGLSDPVYVTAPPGDTSRLFILQQTGQIRILNLATGAVNATEFIDIRPQITTGGEQGLLGLAFDPNYATNRKFYVNYTALRTSSQLETRVSQFAASQSNADVADPGSEKILLRFDQPQTNHNGGWIGFSPRANDGNNLYIASGDGGGSNDSGAGHLAGGNAQSPTTLLGKMLRITIDAAAGTYSIPANNPFATGANGARPEVWTTGLRNPYRAGFDRQSGTLFIGDVGQSAREEISVQKASNAGGGENYGWRLREGTIATPDVGGPQPPGGVDPVFDYDRTIGRTVIGGYVYRGRQIPTLRGVYVFGDYLGAQGGNNRGRIFTFNYDGAIASNFQDITAQLFPAGGAFTLLNPSSFGEDANGEIYITDISSDSVYRIAPVTPNVGITSITRVSAAVQLRGFGVPFKPHRVEAVTKLVEQFETVATINAAGDGALEFDDAVAAGETQRFYRIAYP